jgi:hypothetical protein
LAYLTVVEGITFSRSRHRYHVRRLFRSEKGGRRVEVKKSTSTSETPLYKGVSKERWKVEDISTKKF